MRLAILALVATTAIRPGGDLRDASMRPQPPASGGGASTVTLDAMPYERTVTCSSYTVTGTYTGSAPTGWTASPSGDSGSCTDLGAGAFSCNVDVNPDATGEGVETITIGDKTVTIGFYVDGEHSCFLSQSVNGSYNAGLADLDAVATWVNLGSSALNVTQGTGAAQPTFRTGIVAGQPTVRCDGGDNLTASTAADWAFLNASDDYTESVVWATSSANPNALMVVTTTQDIVNATTSRGVALRYDDRAASSNNDRYTATGVGTNVILNFTGANDNFSAARFHDMALVHDDDGGAGADWIAYVDNASAGTYVNTGTYSSSAPASALRLCQNTTAAFFLTGDLFRVLIYQSALTSTQRGINKAVDEWALGGTLPVPPPLVRLNSSDAGAITTAGGSVSSWRSSGIVTANATQGTPANQPTSTVSGSSSGVDFDGINDFVTTSSVLQVSASTFHYIAVATVDDAGAGVACGGNVYLNNSVINTGLSGIVLRKSGGIVYAQAYNYDGTSDCVENAIATGEKVIVEARLTGGQVGVAINGSAFSETASGNTTTLLAFVFGGFDGSAGRQMDGRIHEALAFPAALSSGDRTALIDSLKSKWGIP